MREKAQPKAERNETDALFLAEFRRFGACFAGAPKVAFHSPF
jgi:hypothetical protein